MEKIICGIDLATGKDMTGFVRNDRMKGRVQTNKVLEKQTYNQELTELTDKFLSIPTPKKEGKQKKADLPDPERVARELRSLYSDMPPYCVYPDCFHCPYGDCGWTKAGNEESIQELIRAFARKGK